MADKCLEEINSLIENLSSLGKESLLVTIEVAGDIVKTSGSKVGQLFLKKSGDIPIQFLDFCKKFYSTDCGDMEGDNLFREGDGLVCNEKPVIRRSMRRGRGRSDSKESITFETVSQMDRKRKNMPSCDKSGRTNESLLNTGSTNGLCGTDPVSNKRLKLNVGRQRDKEDEKSGSVKVENECSEKNELVQKAIQLESSNSTGMRTRKQSARKKETCCDTNGIGSTFRMAISKKGDKSLTAGKEVKMSTQRNMETKMKMPKNDIKMTDTRRSKTSRKTKESSTTSELTSPLQKVRKRTSDSEEDSGTVEICSVELSSAVNKQLPVDPTVIDSHSDNHTAQDEMSILTQSDELKADRLKEQIEKLSQRIASDNASLLKQLKDQEDIVIMEVEREDDRSECGMQVEFLDTSKGAVIKDDKSQDTSSLEEQVVGKDTEAGLKDPNMHESKSVLNDDDDDNCDKEPEIDKMLLHDLLTDAPISDSVDDTDVTKTGKDACPSYMYVTENKTVLTTQSLVNSKEKKFSCKFCSKRFLRKTDAVRHEETHSIELKYKCTEENCNCIFKTFQGLKKHKINVHAFSASEIKNPLSKRSGQPKSLTCEICSKVFKKLFSLRRHQMVHKNIRPFKCSICGRAFFRKEDMMKHERSHTNERPFTCTVCGKTFKSKQGKAAHVEVFHGSKGLKVGDEDNFKCDICHGIFKSFYTLKNHKKQHDVGDVENIPIRPVVKKEIKEEVDINTTLLSTDGEIEDISETVVQSEPSGQSNASPNQQNLYICDFCGKAFRKPLSLFKHRKLHDREGKFTCSVCFLQCDTQNQLRKHDLVHKEEKPLDCDMCNKSFKGKRNLRLHKLIHTEEKKFICEHCGKAFRVKQQLKDHYRVHTGERPFKCEVCGNAFRMKDTLNNHMAIHNEFKKYMCDTCGKTFRQQSCLLTHQKVHIAKPTHVCSICNKGCKSSSALKSHYVSFHLNSEDIARLGVVVHKCNECGKAFGDRQDRDRHLRMHTGEKPFPCEVCGKRFADRSNMRAHLRNHNAERPQKCELCGKGFLFRRDLKKHMIAHDRNTVRMNITASANVDSPEFVPLPNNCVTVTTQEPVAEQIIIQTFSQDFINSAPSPASSHSRTLSEVSEETFTAASAIALMQEATMSQIETHATVQNVYPEDTELVWQTI